MIYSNVKYYPILALTTIFVSCNGYASKDNSLEYIPALVAIDTKISSWVDSGYYNGAAIRIIKDNETLFESHYGGYTDTTTLHVASAGKWVVAATIAATVDEGKLSWDDKASKYLPELKDIKGEATLRQLLSHTAGYPDYQPQDKHRDDYHTLEEAVTNIVDLSADTVPGTKFKYGGLAMQVAGRMAEIATGKDWEALFQEKIAQPLKMTHSHFTPVSEEAGFNPMLGGGFKTCLSDYMNFLSMIANNGHFEEKQILSEKAIKEIEADQIKEANVKQPEYVINSRQNAHNSIYGLGVWREEVAETGRATLVSSPGWAGAYPWVDRANNVYGFIIAKVDGKAFTDGFSSFYGSAVLPLMVRDAIEEMNYPAALKKEKINIGEAQLYYEEMGDGDPVILIHGHSLNHKMWNKQFFEFSTKYRTIRYDLRGYGYSSPQEDGQQFTHAEDLIKLMDSLQIEKAHIIGLSLGGYIGADMLGWYPDRILSAVLASGNIRHNPKPSVPMNVEESKRRDIEIAALKKEGVDVMKRNWLGGLMNSGGSLKERMREPLWSMIYQWSAWQPLHKEARVVAGDDAYDKLKESKTNRPVLIVEGKSENNRYSDQPEILDYLPNGQLVIINDAGHLLNMEQPEIFNETIFNFYNKLK